MQIAIKRVYAPVEKSDGFRILVDRLWPRGLSKEKAKIDLWEKGISPSSELRKWFSHDPRKWEDFQKKYKKEILDNKDVLDILKKEISSHEKVTFLFAAKDEKYNNAQALRKILKL